MSDIVSESKQKQTFRFVFKFPDLLRGTKIEEIASF